GSPVGAASRYRRRHPRWDHQRRACRDQAAQGREQSPAGGCRDPESGYDFLRGGTRPPQPLMLGFIDTMRAEGHAVESIIRVLREQGVKIAARTYRAHRQGVIAARTITDAQVQDAIRAAAWTVVERGGTMRRVLTPEGL